MPTKIRQFAVQGSPVSVIVSIGDGQGGGTTAFLGRRMRTPDATPNSTTNVYELSADEANGRSLVISTVAVDVRDETDRTSVVVTVRDARHEERVEQDDHAPSGGAVSYITVIKFV